MSRTDWPSRCRRRRKSIITSSISVSIRSAPNRKTRPSSSPCPSTKRSQSPIRTRRPADASLPAAQLGDRALEHPQIADHGARAGSDKLVSKPARLIIAADKADRRHARGGGGGGDADRR